MKIKKCLSCLATLFTAFAVGLGLFTNYSVKPTKVEAEQHTTNYDPYTYTGNYYNSINFDATGGMNGALRTSLTTLIKPAGFYTYSGTGDEKLATQLQYADEDPTNSNNMVYFYTRDSVTKNAASSWNREHVWCQSLSNNNWGTSEGGTDILHIRPTYNSANSTRNNHPYGNTTSGIAKYYEGMLYGYLEGDTFEPLDSVKGDVARIIMYMWVTYTGYKSYNALNILSVFESYDTLLSWHTSDRPDVLEGNRNNYTESSKQKNRNPFVDHPELAWKIFGDQASTNVKNACMAAYPANGGGNNPITPTGVELNRDSANLVVGNTLQLTASLQPNGATGSVTWSSNNTSVATVSNTGLVTAVSAGNAIITARISENITATCSITVTSSGGNEQQTGTLFTADLTAEKNVTTGYSITSGSVSLKSDKGYYQDGGTAGTSLNYFKVTKASPLFNSQPGQITFTAHLGAGSTKDPLENNVEVCFVDSNGNDIESTRVILTSSINNDETEYSVTVPYNANAYGVKLSHLKATGHNIRYYSFSLSVSDETPTINSYFSNVEQLKTIVGQETTDNNPVSNNSTITFSELNLENGVQYTSPFNFDDGFSTITFGGGGNDGKYYNTGTAIRTYGNGYFTIASSKTITQITLTWYSTDKPNADDVVDTGSYDSSTSIWTGSASSVRFTRPSGSGHWKLQSATVTTVGGSTVVNNVAMRFGVSIPVNDWNAINNNWSITDYGVMFVRKNTLNNTYGVSTVAEAYQASRNLAVIHRGSGETPAQRNIDYVFSARLNITSTNNYSVVFVAAPFIVAGGSYYFLTQIEYSVNTLAAYCLTNGGSSLSNAALNVLAGN